MKRDVHIRTVWARPRWYAYILCRARPRDRRDILERTPERATSSEPEAEAQLLAAARGWRVRSVGMLTEGAFARGKKKFRAPGGS